MKIVVLGSGGQVGQELVDALGRIAEVTALSRAEGDLANVSRVLERLRAIGPDAVVNAASYNDVDGAEKEPEAAMLVNAHAVGALGEEARRARFAFVHYSTDFVLDGKGASPYVETDPVAPLGAYGRSKLAGEKALTDVDAPAIVLRTAWVDSLRRKSFVSAMLKLGRMRPSLRVVSDQVGNPTFCRGLAQATALLLYGCRLRPIEVLAEARGVYHLAGGGSTSRAELAKATLELARRGEGEALATIELIPSSAYPLPAERPAHAPLDCTKIKERFGIALPPWPEALARALADERGA